MSDASVITEDYGDPECKTCHGRGRIPAPTVRENYLGPAGLQLCRCALYKIIIANVDRGMPGLSDAPKVPSSPLSALVARNAWVTAEDDWFRAHMRHVAIRMSPVWGFRVASDAELMQAWLATVALKGEVEIYDTDVRESRSMKHLTLMDISVPPSLLVVRLGIKTARNVAMSEVLEEAIGMRMHEKRPTWIWDQLGRPFDESHLCHSYSLMETMSGWERVLESDWEVGESQRVSAVQARTGTTPRNLLMKPPARIPLEDITPPVEEESWEEVPPEEESGNSIMDEMMGRAPKVKKKSSGFSGKKGGWGK